MPSVFALIDCNNFYASCERVFDPGLHGRPVVILSNNDGCVIARSAEAKAVEIPMGIPEFKVRPLISRHNVAVRSSNYALYGDMSLRVMETIRSVTPDVEVYSIDEAFAGITASDPKQIRAIGREIRNRVWRWTGLPVSVGIAPTKTLAKIANEIAKDYPKLNGVLYVGKRDRIRKMLQMTGTGDIWGIGKNYTSMLERQGITSALQLSRMPDSWVRSKMKVTGLRTVKELRGEPCLSIEESSDQRKGILSSRCFGKPVKTLPDLCEAVAAFTSRAAEKLRAQSSVASQLSVVLVTDKYRNPGEPYKFGRTVSLRSPTAATTTLSGIATGLTEELFDKEKTYKKAWVMLTGLIPDTEVQADLFSSDRYSGRDHRLMQSMDEINARFGSSSCSTASTGFSRSWQMKQQYLSSRYTTRWDELMKVSL